MVVELSWEGRQLVGITEVIIDAFEYTYEYNDEGIRTSKTIDGVEYKYTLNGSQIVSQEWDNKLIVFFYDESGSPIGYAYRTTSMAADTFYYYVYEKNLQGDIVAIYNTSGTKLISYTYDAWGNVSVSNINISGTNAGAQYNPFRYRGYYYDEEIGLYYLNSRYYDPSTGRFLNSDSIMAGESSSVHGHNLYVYCFNNPVVLTDPSGNWPKWLDDFFGWVEDKYDKAYDYIYNTDEQKVLSAKHFAFYKGVPVIKIDSMGSDAFSFGVIFMGNGNYLSSASVKHEYGHSVQMKNTGPLTYLVTVALPSVFCYWTQSAGIYYYDMPWERKADELGGVTEDDIKHAHRKKISYAYWSDGLSDLYYIAQRILSYSEKGLLSP